MKLGKYSFGIGDRFGHQGPAQLKAIEEVMNQGLTITPVWNKSHREHEIIKTTPGSVRTEADDAVNKLGWDDAYFVDADHITMDTIEDFLVSSNYFTIDVADFIGNGIQESDEKTFLEKNGSLIGDMEIPGISEKFEINESLLKKIAHNYINAIKEARRIYQHIKKEKGDDVVIEISMDEVEKPQTPVELFFILKTLSEYDVQINTIAPKFTGRFNKGVDYVGDLDKFSQEFEQDILVIKHVISDYHLPEDLKLSVHSGSDKFSIYDSIHNIIKQHDSGLHVKTSGTTWLEELIGLASADNDGLQMVQSIYKTAWSRFKELTDPYAPVIDVDYEGLPTPDTFNSWESKKVVAKLTHNPDDPEFDSQLRQFLHCSYKIAAEKKSEYYNLLKKYEKVIGSNVTNNLYKRHLKPLFLE
ncbi:MAG TPA: tagaturonate epimerase family protein [Balneolales bacterium]|nr:tagaturonate epimerase family protein [Balneolales bacterium]